MDMGTRYMLSTECAPLSHHHKLKINVKLLLSWVLSVCYLILFLWIGFGGLSFRLFIIGNTRFPLL